MINLEEIEEKVKSGAAKERICTFDEEVESETESKTSSHIKDFVMNETLIIKAINEFKISKSRDSIGISREMIKNIQETITSSLARLGTLLVKKRESTRVPEDLPYHWYSKRNK